MVRVKKVRGGGEAALAGSSCATFECNGDTVTICIQCLFAEPPEECQERLDAAIAAYKKVFGC